VTMVLGGAIIFIFAIVAAIAVICMKAKSARHTEPEETDPPLQSAVPDDDDDDRTDQPGPNQQSTYQSI